MIRGKSSIILVLLSTDCEYCNGEKIFERQKYIICFLPLGDQIHIFEPACNVFFIII